MAICCVIRPPHCLGGVAKVAPYSSRRHPSSFGGPRRGGISQGSTCICLPAEALAQAGPFLSNLEKMTLTAAC